MVAFGPKFLKCIETSRSQNYTSSSLEYTMIHQSPDLETPYLIKLGQQNSDFSKSFVQ
jgi:hypothetical protein